MTATDKPTQEKTVVIRKFQMGDAQHFRSLNESWIKKYFTLEPEDLLTLNDPETYVLAKGGEVFFAVEDGRVVGCCALLAASPGVFELAKMAVVEEVRGKGVGRKLLTAALDEARRLGATSVILGSNTTLANAVHLYESVGFRHVPPEELPPSPYSRANVHMRLYLL